MISFLLSFGSSHPLPSHLQPSAIEEVQHPDLLLQHEAALLQMSGQHPQPPEDHSFYVPVWQHSSRNPDLRSYIPPAGHFRGSDVLDVRGRGHAPPHSGTLPHHDDGDDDAHDRGRDHGPPHSGTLPHRDDGDDDVHDRDRGRGRDHAPPHSGTHPHHDDGDDDAHDHAASSCHVQEV